MSKTTVYKGHEFVVVLVDYTTTGQIRHKRTHIRTHTCFHSRKYIKTVPVPTWSSCQLYLPFI